MSDREAKAVPARVDESGELTLLIEQDRSRWDKLFLVASIALAATASAPATTPTGADVAIHQEVDFNASPERIYNALLTDKQFSAFTGASAHIQREAGGAFKLFGGRVTGRNIEVEPNPVVYGWRIVQAWRVESWPSGVYSIVRFGVTKKGSGTEVVLDHTAFPPKDREALSGNWFRMYWEPLHKYVDSHDQR